MKRGRNEPGSVSFWWESLGRDRIKNKKVSLVIGKSGQTIRCLNMYYSIHGLPFVCVFLVSQPDRDPLPPPPPPLEEQGRPI